MDDIFDIVVREHISAVNELKNKKDVVIEISKLIKETLLKDGKILICGNGGSASDSAHMAAELVGRFQKERKPMAAISLTTDTSVLTSISNDYSFESVFERQVEAVGKNGDVLIGFSTSGKSKNVIRAFEKARIMGIKTVGILGNPGSLKTISDISFELPGNTARVQEIHSILIHIICEMIEK